MTTKPCGHYTQTCCRLQPAHTDACSVLTLPAAVFCSVLTPVRTNPSGPEPGRYKRRRHYLPPPVSFADACVDQHVIKLAVLEDRLAQAPLELVSCFLQHPG